MNYPSPKGDGVPLSSNSFGVVQRLLRVVPTLVFLMLFAAKMSNKIKYNLL